MTVEMACGNCQGRFVVAAAGTVACPHCGTHLMVSAESFPSTAPANAPFEADTAEEARTQVPVEPVAEKPIAATFAGYAGLSESGQPASRDAESAADRPVGISSTIDLKESSEIQPVPDTDQDISQPPVVNSANSEAEAAVDSATISDTIELPESPPEDIASSGNAENIPDFSSLDFGGGVPAEESAPTEFPSFDAESETPTIEFSEGEMPSFDFGDKETSDDSLGQDEATVIAESEERVTETALPNFNSNTNDGGANDIGDAFANTADDATIVEERPVSTEGQAEAIPDGADDTQKPASLPVAAVTATDPGIPRTWFLILASYASAMTIVCIWLLIQFFTGKHQLENLKDPAEIPKDSKKKIVQLYQVDAVLPRGHVLALGESQRFGNILVEPIKVTRGPLQFVHFSSDVRNGKPKENTDPTLKLWLRLTNQSSDQTIAPLDRILLYTNRVSSEDHDYELRGNTFVCRKADKRKEGHLVFVYALNANDIWDLRGQNLEPLAPGESMLTYIPAEPGGIDELKGDLTWRVHFRKGYSPSKKGVTTLLEVDFNSNDIQADGKAT